MKSTPTPHLITANFNYFVSKFSNMKLSVLKPIFFTLSLIFIATMSASSQNPVKNYDANWKKVEAATNKGLPKSALAEVKTIYALAKKEGQDAQVIKCLIYFATLQGENREANEVLSISEMEKELAGSKEPAASVLKSILAELYWNYFQEKRWQIYNRTKTDKKFSKKDIDTWDIEDFHQRISELYLESIKNEKQLQKQRLETFDAIIIKGNMRHLRPTLFDLLAHRAIDYFENDERDISKPAYAFEINQAEAFAPAAEFVKQKFTTKDSASLHHKAILLYQKIIAFHLADAKPDALIDVDLQRIAFVKQNSTHPDKDIIYFTAISHIANKYGDLPAAAQAWYLIAAYHSEQANEYKPFGDTTYRYSKIKAKEITDRILKQKDSSEGKINAFNLLHGLQTKSLQFNLEKVNVPGQPFRSLVEYKNISTLYLRVIKADDNLKKLLDNYDNDKYWAAIISAKPVTAWEQSLPATKDMQQHNVEIKINALPVGDYILAASDSKGFDGKKTIMGARLFHVSNISYVNNSNDYFVLNRDNGQPLAKATVQVWEQKYDYNTGRNTKEKGPVFTTDANGYFLLPQPKKEANNYTSYTYMLDIKHNDDRLFMNEFAYAYRYNDYAETNEQVNTTVHFFTDRSIYRPGQTVYFKGIVLRRSNKENKSVIAANYSTTVVLRDANYQDADTLKVKTNEYGSFSGKFQLPQSGMNGQFSLYIKKEAAGQAGFRVEE
jgi:hypothetical protein